MATEHDTMTRTVLKVGGLNAWYGESHVLHGMDFDVGEGEVVTLLGRNGAGKTTTLKAIMGLMEKRSGSVEFGGVETISLPANRIGRLGIGYCPEERGIFSSLNVEENLLLPPVVRKDGLTTEEIFDLFPNLLERLHSQGTKLSGGEQQMLAIARISGPARSSSCWTNRPKAWPRSSSSRSGAPSKGCGRRGSPSFWLNRTCALPRRSPTGSAWSNTGRSSTP